MSLRSCASIIWTDNSFLPSRVFYHMICEVKLERKKQTQESHAFIFHSHLMLVGQVNDLLSFSHSFSKSSLCLLDRKFFILVILHFSVLFFITFLILFSKFSLSNSFLVGFGTILEKIKIQK